jgi:galactoside O-acetyltransferase
MSKKNENYNSDFLSPEELGKLNFKKLGKNVKISKNVLIVGCKNISLGDNIRIDGFTSIIAFYGKISIGSNTHIGPNTYLYSSNLIKIGNFCGIGPNTNILTTIESYDGTGLNNVNLFETYKKNKYKKFQKLKSGKIIIFNHVIIGYSCLVYPNTIIENNTSISSHSLVYSKLRGGFIYGGNPIKKI